MSANEEKEFTIMLVDDDIESIRAEISEVEQYLKEKNRKMKLLPDNTGEKVDEFLDTNSIELALTDKSILTEDDGLKIIDKVRNKSDLIDILLYSAKGIKLEDYRQASLYTSVQVYEDKTIADITKSLIDRNLAKWNDVIFLRGIVISKIIDLELEINSIFVEYFKVSQDKAHHFNDLILENTFNSLEGKKSALVKIADERGIASDIEGLSTKVQYLQKYRNILAHAKSDERNRKLFIRMGSSEEINKEKMEEIFGKITEVTNMLGKVKGKLAIT